MTKLQAVLVLTCLAHLCLSASIGTPEMPVSNSLEQKKDNSSEELTMADVEKIKQELLTTLPENEAEGITAILRKFTKDATDEDKFEGFIQFMMLGFAASQNKNGTETMKLFAESSEERVGLKKED